MRAALGRFRGLRAGLSMLAVLAVLGGGFLFLYGGVDPGFLPGLGPALILHEGFESGELRFRCSGNCPEVVRTSEARAGTHVMKSVLSGEREDPARTEVRITSGGRGVNFDPGREYWIGLSVKLADGFARRGIGQGVLLQLHYRAWKYPDLRDAQPLVLRYIGSTVRVHNEVVQSYLVETPPAYGEWIDWVIHLKLAEEDGILEVWRNGKKIVDFTGDTHMADIVDGAYLKIGNYSAQLADGDPARYERVTYHDELRVAGPRGSYEMVDPARGGERPSNTRQPGN